MKILIIGGGNMGLTYAQSIIRSHISSKDDMMILEKNEEKAALLAKKGIGTVYSDGQKCLSVADLIILAVKPQDTSALFSSLKPLVDPQQVFMSIMAGVKIETICEELGITKVIRAMPNLPSQIGYGMTGFTASESVTRIELAMVQNLINTTGKSLYVNDEDKIDAVTAISGSGPAYVFYFMDALMKAAKKMGFSSSESELLVGQTFKGAVDLVLKSEDNCDTWISRVASRGGTTEAALNSFLENKVHEDIRQAAKAAYNRAVELGNK